MADSGANLATLEAALGVSFSDRALLREALTHRSYLNENPGWSPRHNERLEYLGDAVIELVITEALFHAHPDADEGELTAVRAALVNYQSLARVAEDLSLGSYIRMSRGEAKDKGRAREVIMANAMEAVIGAAYLEAGAGPVRAIAEAHLLPRAAEILATKSYKDPKSALQEAVQERHRVTPTYEVTAESGPAHQRTFTVAVLVGGERVGEGTGPSKQEAEVEAARAALAAYQR